MNRLWITIAITLLLGGFAASTFASFNGVGLLTSGDSTSRSVFFPVFVGGGPGGGK